MMTLLRALIAALVLPGGGGGADFHPFVKNIWKLGAGHAPSRIGPRKPLGVL
ncbi:MAG TPA: hypothetical protein VGK61_09835 [Planctomycetota bacterium]|jgi:hypothetical protein